MGQLEHLHERSQGSLTMKQRFACFREDYSLHHHAKCQLGRGLQSSIM